MHRPMMFVSQRHGPTWCGGGCNCLDRHIQYGNIEYENPVSAAACSFQGTFDEDTDILAGLFSPVRLPSQPTTSLSVSTLRRVPGTWSKNSVANPARAGRSIGNGPKEQQRGSSRFSERRSFQTFEDTDDLAVLFSPVRLPSQLTTSLSASTVCVATSTQLQASALPTAASTHEEFAEELVCSVCLELLWKPVLLLCGHSFCQSCIDTVCKDKETCPCPVCRQMFEKGKYIKIVALESLAEKMREGTPLRNSSKKWTVPLVARDAPKHKDNRLLPTQDAVRTFKDWPRACVGALNATRRKSLDQKKICRRLTENQADQLREGLVTLNATRRKCLDQTKNHERLIANHKDQPRDSLLTTNQAAATVTGKCLDQRKSRKQLIEVHQLSSIAVVFERLHVALADRRVKMVDEQQIHEEEAKKSMEDCFSQLQEDCQKARETLESAQKSLDQEDPLEFLKGITSCLTKCSKEYIGRDPAIEVSGTPVQLLPEDLINCATWKLLKYSLSPAPSQLTLDPNSAHCELNVSGDHTSVWYSGAKRWLWDDRKRFYEARAVLASKGFISGEHYWEVHMGKAASWVIGVAEESINREDEVPLVPSSGLWVLALGQCKAFQRLGTAKTSSKVVSSISRSQKVGVYLDYEHGVLSFYNATNMSRIHSLHFLTKSRLFPYFHFSGDVTKGTSELLTLCF